MVLGYTKGHGFESKILSGEKLHSIRADIKNRWRRGNEIQHITGNRTSQRSQFASGVCTGTQEIVIVYDDRGKIETVRVGGREVLGWEKIAKNDGLSITAFEGFFYSEAGLFKGKIIHWTNERY